MPGGIYTCIMALAFFLFVLVALFFRDDTRLGLTYTPVWFIIVGIAYYLIPKRIKDMWTEETKSKLRDS